MSYMTVSNNVVSGNKVKIFLNKMFLLIMENV